MKKIAQAIWGNRISPVFDVSDRVRILEVEDSKVINRTELVLSAKDPYGKASMLADKGTEILICGAVSRLFSEALAAHGIRVVSFVTGEADEVIEAYLDGNLDSARFAMPGCRGRRKMRRRGCRKGW